jgi:hypothetical protein
MQDSSAVSDHWKVADGALVFGHVLQRLDMDL